MGEVDNYWLFIFGWTYPLIRKGNTWQYDEFIVVFHGICCRKLHPLTDAYTRLPLLYKKESMNA